MYSKILVCLDGVMDIDEHILDHVGQLAKELGSRLLLLRVAHYHTRDSRIAEIDEARQYSEEARERLEAQGVSNVEVVHASGEPAEAIIRVADEQGADLIAMSTHGHKFAYDLVFGSVSDQVRHNTALPVLLIRHPARR